MENGPTRWGFRGNRSLQTASSITIRGVLTLLMENLNPDDDRPTIPLGHGDPSAFPCFRTTPVAVDAIFDSVRSAKFNGYAPTVGLLPARSAIAEYLSQDLPYKLTPDDVFLTIGCTQAIELIISVLSCPNANILLPRPGFPYYEARTAFNHFETRHYDLLPEKGWEVDLDAVEALADENTVAMVIINPGNPCGNVFTYQHLKNVAETARKLGILVIADEVYDHLTFGNNPFVPMGVFGSIAPVVTVGSISKRWIVPGWRLGWLVTNDPNGILKKYEIVDCIKGSLDISGDPPTFIQGAVPQILQNTKCDFFSKIVNILREDSDICFDTIKEIPSITCPSKPQGSMFVMVKLNLSLLEDISDDMDFCVKLAKEESVIILPGIAVGLKNWLRITFAVEPSSLADGLGRLKDFCTRHAKKYLLLTTLPTLHPLSLSLSLASNQFAMAKSSKEWCFGNNEGEEEGELIPDTASSTLTVRSAVDIITKNLSDSDRRPTVYLCYGDPSPYQSFRTSPLAEDAIVDSVRSSKFNGYPPNVGILPARRAIAEYLSRDLPYQLSSDNIYITAGAHHAIEVVVRVLDRPGANILVPRPGYPHYEACSEFSHFEARYFDLVPEKGWEVDLDGVESLADNNTAAIVVINPGNPCGNVFRYEHLKKVAELARKLGILVIADEVYHHLAFGCHPFVPIGVFGSIVPVLTIGSISKRWMVPGWRLGWIATTDPSGILKKYGIIRRLEKYFNISAHPATITQGAVAQIIGSTTEDFFSKTVRTLKEAAGICFDKLEEIPCISCPHKPEGAMSLMVKLNLSLLEDITDDMEFSIKLAQEESVIVLPGVVVGLKNWLRLTFAVEPSLLEDGLERFKTFCSRHAKKVNS